MQFSNKRPFSALGTTESVNAKRVKYLSRQEESLMMELEISRDLLAEKRKAILDTHEKVRKREAEIMECGKQIRKIEAWKELSKLKSITIKLQTDQLVELERNAKGLPKEEVEKFTREIERLKNELAAEEEWKDEEIFDLEKRAELYTLERNCRLALHELNELKGRVQMGEHIEKEIESVNKKLRNLETVEEQYLQTKSKLKDAQQTTEEWQKTVLEFFGKGENLKTPMEAKIRFMVYQQQMLVKAASPHSFVAMEEKGKKYEIEMTKLQERIQKLTKALQQNTKTIEQERVKGKEAKKLQLKAECKVRALKKEVENLTKEQCMEDDIKGRAIATFFDTQLG